MHFSRTLGLSRFAAASRGQLHATNFVMDLLPVHLSTKRTKPCLFTTKNDKFTAKKQDPPMHSPIAKSALLRWSAAHCLSLLICCRIVRLSPHNVSSIGLLPIYFWTIDTKLHLSVTKNDEFRAKIRDNSSLPNGLFPSQRKAVQRDAIQRLPVQCVCQLNWPMEVCR